MVWKLLSANLSDEEFVFIEKAMKQMRCETKREFIVNAAKLIVNNDDPYILKDKIEKKLITLRDEKIIMDKRKEVIDREEQGLNESLSQYNTKINKSVVAYKKKILANIARKIQNGEVNDAKHIAKEQSKKLNMKPDDIMREARTIERFIK